MVTCSPSIFPFLFGTKHLVIWSSLLKSFLCCGLCFPLKIPKDVCFAIFTTNSVAFQLCLRSIINHLHLWNFWSYFFANRLTYLWYLIRLGSWSFSWVFSYRLIHQLVIQHFPFQFLLWIGIKKFYRIMDSFVWRYPSVLNSRHFSAFSIWW